MEETLAILVNTLHVISWLNKTTRYSAEKVVAVQLQVVTSSKNVQVRPLVVSLAPSKLQLSVATCLLHHLTVEADQSNFESALPDWLVLPETPTNQQRPGRSKLRLPDWMPRPPDGSDFSSTFGCP